MVPPAQSLLSPKIDRHAQAVLYEALLQDRQVRFVCHRRGAKDPVEYTAHVLGLVQRGPAFYAVCTIFRHEDIRLPALHRVLSATLLDEPSRHPRDFDLDAHIAEGGIDFGSGRKIRLEALVAAEAAAHLDETPLSEDQAIRPAGDGRVKLNATLIETPQLEWRLSAFADRVEVLKPVSTSENAWPPPCRPWPAFIAGSPASSNLPAATQSVAVTP